MEHRDNHPWISHGLLLLFLLSAPCWPSVYVHGLRSEALPGMLYPRDSESRETKLLDGLWHFRADDSPTRHRGFDEKWWEASLTETGPVIDMPVPSSYNDITEDRKLRDFVGWAWYDRTFFTSPSWNTQRVMLRLDSAHYNTQVWVNGKPVLEHSGGHLPFESDVSDVLSYTGSNHITVAVNNTMTPDTLPPGTIDYETDTSEYPPGYFVQKIQFDFFNYAGIHRHVRLYTTPKDVYVDDITILTDVDGSSGIVKYTVSAGGSKPASKVEVSVLDAGSMSVVTGEGLTGNLTVLDAHLWWPFGMNESVGYMYTLQVNVDGDIYRQPFGIRSVDWTDKQFLINKKPFYCLGVGRHEDSDIRGKGLDYALFTKDFNMLRWLGVNCFRTSHYPYAEEILEFADRQGVAIIDECPGVGIKTTDNFDNTSLQHHLHVMSELVRRDKNKPSVIMWSFANEPSSHLDISVPYFRAVINHTRAVDPTHRPLTFASSQRYYSDKVVAYVDVICFNRYVGWYEDSGQLDTIQLKVTKAIQGFWDRHKKPIIVTEYGAGTVPGLHREPSYVFTEEFQKDVLREHHKAYDVARKEFLVGEMVWNYADFMTTQSVGRVVGNKKGLLTRQRQPKQAAFLIRERYHSIAKGEQGTCAVSDPASKYTVSPHSYKKP